MPNAISAVSGSIIARALIQNRRIIFNTVIHELKDAYAQHVLGVFWTFGQPLAQMLVYVLVFGYILNFRLDAIGGSALSPDYTIFLLSGILPWIALLESMNRGSVAVIGNAGLVKEVVFPIEVLPARVVAMSALTQLVYWSIFVLFAAIKGAMQWTYVLLPALIFFQLLAALGLALMLSAFTALIRDIQKILASLGGLMIFAAPITYPIEWAPEIIKVFLYLNPVTYMVWCYQDALSHGSIVHPIAWIIFPALSVAAFFLGSRCFLHLKHLFGDVL